MLVASSGSESNPIKYRIDEQFGKTCAELYYSVTAQHAHPSWPWTDESLSMVLHKANVYIDLSGWSPKYFPEQVIRYANTQLSHKMLFGSDFPLIRPDAWIEAAKQAGFREHVLQAIVKDNAVKLLKLNQPG